MFGSLTGFLKRKLLSPKGSVTLEATILFPSIMIILFTLLFFSMFIFEKFIALDTAVYTASQRVATWGNSFKHLESSAQGGVERSDGLYWRLVRDFDNSDLAARKTQEAYNLALWSLEAGVFNNSPKLLVEYNNQMYRRLVKVSVYEKVSLPRFAAGAFGSDVSARAQAAVVEPVEYIRNVDSLSYYGDYLKTLMELLKNRRDQVEKVYITRNEYEEKVYHTNPSCRYVKRIDRNGNLLVPHSSGQVMELGYRACKVCAMSRQ